MGDGPMPPLATLEGLRSQHLFVLVEKAVWRQGLDYSAQVHCIFLSHMGGGTSLSAKLLELFSDGLCSVRAALRSESFDRATCELIGLTRSMADNDEWWKDTDEPQRAADIVGELGSLWSIVLRTCACYQLGLPLSWSDA